MQQNKKFKKENTDTLRKKIEDKIPKNVRQIGNVSQNTKIYIEEYVLNYVKRLQKDARQKNGKFLCVMIGEKHVAPKTNYFFIEGALKLDADIKKINGVLSEETKKQLTRTMENYFGKENSALCQIGWSSSLQNEDKLPEEYELFHRGNFGTGNALFLGIEDDGEEIFYIYENGKLKKQAGYYIYFDRNEGMQQYVEDNQPSKCLENDALDKAKSASYRMLLANKKEDIQNRRLITFLYTASTFLVMVVVVLGITLINHYDKIEDMQNVIASLSKSVIDQDAGNSPDLALKEVSDTAVSEVTDTAVGVTSDAAIDYVSNGAIDEVSDEAVNQEITDETMSDSEESVVENNSELIEENDGESESLMQGEAQAQAAASSANSSLDNSDLRQYEIKEGDTLIKICKNLYGSIEYMEQICEYNGIENSDEIIVGQKIWVP